ncbi:type IV toxin-antitoxin system AbiEi family antitoxin domain-containing protein [Microbacterium sp. RD1]|uniref:type IV toxin-antitoxin system AbiEi family antitoxin domain-containing protein n=1 Tax=Microbacterium sp. RD1 TaxID=3457313 RepID=UPI003FA598EC
MTRHLLLPELDTALLSRHDLVRSGMTDEAIARAVERGDLVRVRRGWFMDARDHRELWPESRHRAEVLAVTREMRGGTAVVSHVSAAVLWDLPLYRTTPSRVHVTVSGGLAAPSTPSVFRHRDTLEDSDVTTIRGIRCTTLERTVWDVLRTASLEAAVACADAALRLTAVTDRAVDEERAGLWRQALRDRAGQSVGARGARQARWVIEFADGLAELPGESVSRLHLHRLGFPAPRLQVRVPGPAGRDYWVDFGFDEIGAFGEFDGVGKYLELALRSGRTVEQVMLDEKRREDWIRGTTQRRLARWGSEHIGTPEVLGQRLAGFGIRPPRG